MLHNTLRLRFDLFDGEGAGGEGSGLGPEASAFLEEIGAKEPERKEPEAKPDVRQIQYGKSTGDDQASQVGSDNGEDISAEFAALIGKDGRYHDIYGQMVSNAIQSRFKNQANLQGQVDTITNDLSPLFMHYGLKSGDFEGLGQAISNDEDFYRSGAEREGVDIEQYKKNLQLRADAERGRQITEAYEQQQRQNEMFAQWETEAEQLRGAFPNFDLGLEIESNEQFAKLIDSGVDITTAFVSTHLNDIISGSTAEASRTATQNVVNTIKSRAARPAENGLNRVPALQRKSDPSQLSNDDMDEIFRRVENGEAFSF